MSDWRIFWPHDGAWIAHSAKYVRAIRTNNSRPLFSERYGKTTRVWHLPFGLRVTCREKSKTSGNCTSSCPH